MFYDEFGFSFLEALGPTWAPRGQRPIIRRVTRERRVLTTAVGLVWSGKIYKRYFSKGMDSLDVIAAWKHLLRHLPKGFILICDQAPIHTSKVALWFLWAHPEIVVEPLPKYAPELNPEEYCHGNVKRRLTNVVPADQTAMCKALDRGFARLRRRPDLLLSFMHAAGLSVRQLT